MRVDKRLNLIVPLERENDTVYIHAMPISVETFEANWLLISKAYARIFSEGLSIYSAPAIASLLLKTMADQMGVPDAAASLLTEIRRLSNVVLPGPAGWETLPLQNALDRQSLDADDIREAEGAMVFFTLVSAMARRREVPQILGIMSEMWSVRATSLTLTEFKNSLPILTPDVNTGETVAASSIPH